MVSVFPDPIRVSRLQTFNRPPGYLGSRDSRPTVRPVFGLEGLSPYRSLRREELRLLAHLVQNKLNTSGRASGLLRAFRNDSPPLRVRNPAGARDLVSSSHSQMRLWPSPW